LIQYPQHLVLPGKYVKNKIKEFLDEDIPNGDITTFGTVKKNVKTTAVLQAQQNLIFAGEQILNHIFPKSFNIALFYKDGSFVKSNEIIAKIIGSAAYILSVERVMLNLIQRLCGIATLTQKYSDIAKPFNVKILDTRKTTPGLRLFEKYAVAVGGGFNHRLDLSSGILIKDNHIKAAGSIPNAVRQIKQNKYPFPIEVECENEFQILEALECKVDGALLDNMPPDVLKKAVKLIRNHPQGKKIFIEASGGITLDNLKKYVVTGVDAISIGALTHSAKGAELHLEFI
jgi:nicotinate-nucleotide pyrophosphorylase (carboxylating)